VPSVVGIDVNDADMVAGSASIPDPPDAPGSGLVHACLWIDGVMTDLGVLPEAGEERPFGPELVNSFASGFNLACQVVGNSYPGSLTRRCDPGPSSGGETSW
jgi:hypothetical protein